MRSRSELNVVERIPVIGETTPDRPDRHQAGACLYAALAMFVPGTQGRETQVGSARRSGWSRVEVAGQSMSPTLSPGDWLLCKAVRGIDVRPGEIVVAEQPNRPGFLVIKRVIRRVDGGWWLEGDNPVASDDSRVFGPVSDDDVRSVVRYRYWPSPTRLSR